MRGVVVLSALAGALLVALPSSAALVPVKRDFGELTVPRVRAGKVVIPRGHRTGRVTVIARLALPPLAAVEGTLASRGGARRKLSVGSASSRAYLSRLASAQAAAVAALRRELPEATVRRRYRILLNALAVDLPVRKLPELVRMGVFTRVAPSVGYTLATNRSPGHVGATALAASTGARGEGVKIAVVDDGVDERNPYFDPTGFTYPSGYPKGGRRWTTPKVIVARAFPGPGSGRAGRLAVDRRTSFHGTHVAGIAAGNASTVSTGGRDHPPTLGLSGVAPRAQIGNYRVFAVPTPIGNVAMTPEIVAAFEAAVTDGMDVINFSGGSPQFDPANDPLVEAVRNVAAAGVVPVISSGNDRDEFGLGSSGSPGTAAEAITVAAASNSHVFTSALSVTTAGAPSTLATVPFRPGGSGEVPFAWGSSDQTLVDVASVTGTDGRPVDPYLCGPANNPNGTGSTIARGSLTGALVLVNRGYCTFVSKAARAQLGGAIGMVVIDNRAGEANRIPINLQVASGSVADLDGQRLRSYLAARGGRASIRIRRDPAEIDTGRSGVITSFSSAGPTAFGHALKPDVAAPGGEILSATLTEFAGAPFAVFDGTSMSAPHGAGAAALLVQRHPAWTPRQVKSALVSTAGPAWADTARMSEAPVLLQGGGMIDVSAADDPRIFSDPASLSFADLNVLEGAARRSLILTVSDAGGGAGTWTVELRPQSATPGTAVDVPSAFTLAAGGTVDLAVTARAAANAPEGDDYGFLVLRRGSIARRVPYAFFVTRPALQRTPPLVLRRIQSGTTITGVSGASRYRFPTSPFGHPPSYAGPAMVEDGAERLYVARVDEPAANVGVSIMAATGAVDPFFLGSPDENDVQGYSGTPTNINPMSFGFGIPIGAAGAVFPRQERFYVAVDSGRDEFTGQSFPGRYILRSWVNDVTPPRVRLVTRRVAAGRPTLVLRALDGQSGVDPISVVIGYGRVAVGAAAYDPFSGLAVIPIPQTAPRLARGRRAATLVAADLQEAKNSDVTGRGILPNTTFRPVRIQVVRGTTADWLLPSGTECSRGAVQLLVVASSTRRITAVRFFDGRRRVATVRRGVAGLYSATWRTGRLKKGRHAVRAVVSVEGGPGAAVRRSLRVC